MPRTLLSCILGFFSFFAWFAGAEIFEVPGQNSVRENVAGCIALFLYMLRCQLMLPRDPTADTAEDWRVRACMVALLVPFALLILVTERRSTFLPQVPILAAGTIGVLLGGILARLLSRSAQADAACVAATSRFLGNTGAALYAGVFAILFAMAVLVMPAIVSDTLRYAPPRSAIAPTMVVAALHLIFAAAVFWRTRKGKAPIFPAIFGFLMTLPFAAGGAAWMGHGVAMRLGATALILCAAMDVAACGCCAGVAIQRRDVPVLLEGYQ
jgi:hypothetical protein